MSGRGLLTVERYLADLPDGVASYPTYVQKASVLRSFLTEGAIPAALLQRLPPELRAGLEPMPPVNQWIPEAHANAVILGVRDLHFDTDDAFERWVYQQNLALLRGPLYIALFRVVGPTRVMNGGAARWAQFHRGITLSIRVAKDQQAEVTLTCPPELLGPLMARCYTTAFRAALEIAGAKDVSVRLAASHAKGFDLTASWR